jgi:glycosyltransferase involved in cell wall biosynthesis
MVGDPEKKEILRKSRALLFPVRWHEPFGIAITEALASGCAVFGTPYGSLPEIINSEVGFLSAREDEIVQALRSKSFTPAACRARVSQGFTHLDMAKSYLEHYQSVSSTGFLKGQSAATPAPKTKAGFVANDLLPWN